MKKIASFTVNHDTLTEGIYIAYLCLQIDLASAKDQATDLCLLAFQTYPDLHL